MPLTVEQFTQRLASSGVMSEDSLLDVLSPLNGNVAECADGEQLARELVKQKKLTKFQAEQIYAGKEKSLTLGNYILLDKLGQGGMGMVLKAQHKRMKRLVALKVMSPAAVKTPDSLKRFHREVEAAAKLRHPNIVAADDADEAKGTHFLVMEYVDGSDLSVLVKKHGPLPVEQAVQCIIQAARGLEFAHEQGVIHRDIKPANLLIDAKGTVKILDMGLARIEGAVGGSSEGAGLTSTGTIMGTVDYMSPEQAMDTKHADARSDIYSLGCTLYYLLTGRVAYDGDTIMKKLMAHQNAPIPSLVDAHRRLGFRPDPDGAAAGRDGVPTYDALNAVFRRMVAKRPEDRPQTMTQVMAELERCLSGGSPTIAIQPNSSTTTSGVGSGNELQDFLRQISGGESSTATSAAPAGSKGTAVASSSGEAETMISSAGEGGTDPRTDQSLTIERSGEPMGVSPRTVRGLTPSGSPSHKMKLWFGSIAAVVVVLLAIVFAVRGKSGTLHLEITDDHTEVTIGETGRVVKGVADEEVRLPLGEHVLHVERGELKFDTPAITVAKGDPIAIKVERVGNRIRVMRGNEFLTAKELPRSKSSGTKAGSSSAPNYALKFDGQSHVEIPSLKWDGKEPVTLEFVVSVDAEEAAVAGSLVVASWPSPKSEKELLAYRISNIWAFDARHLNKRWISSVNTLRPNERVLVTCIWDGKQTLIQANADQGNVFEDISSPFVVGPGLWIGGSESHANGAMRFRGTIEQVRVSKGVRTALSAPPAGKLPKDSSTLALYHFAEGRGSVLKDSSGNNHHGKIVGAKWVKADGAAINPTASPPDGPPAFVLTRDKQRVGAFQTLAEAFAQLGQDNVIEIHGNGPFAVGNLKSEGKNSLTLKSAPGYRARITPTDPSFDPRRVIFQMTVVESLRVEGIDIISDFSALLFNGFGKSWHIQNCRLVVLNQQGRGAIRFEGSKLRLEDSLLLLVEIGGAVALPRRDAQQVEVVNNVIFQGADRPFCQSVYQDEFDYALKLERNTMFATLSVGFNKVPKRKALSVEAVGNLFGQTAVLAGEGLDTNAFLWQGRDNVYFDSIGVAADVTAPTRPRISLKSWISDHKRDEQNSREINAVVPQWNDLATTDPDQFAGRVLDLAKTLHTTHKAGADVSKWPAAVEAAAQTSDPDRRAATYILSVGGSVRINEIPQDYTDVRELPKSRFRLTSITVSDSPKISDAGLAACRGCQHLTQLTMVAPVGDAGLEPFRECKKLKELVLYHTKVTDAGLAYFSGCRDLTTLTILEGRQVTDLGLSHFKDCTKLESLGLSRLQMTEKGIGHFRDCQNLRSLSIRNSPLDDAAFAHLKNFPKLTRLDFASDQMTNAGLVSLPSLKDLTLLVLAGTQVDDAGVEHLKKLTKLTRLNLVLNKLTSAGLAELKKALPDCTIDTDIMP